MQFTNTSSVRQLDFGEVAVAVCCQSKTVVTENLVRERAPPSRNTELARLPCRLNLTAKTSRTVTATTACRVAGASVQRQRGFGVLAPRLTQQQIGTADENCHLKRVVSADHSSVKAEVLETTIEFALLHAVVLVIGDCANA